MDIRPPAYRQHHPPLDSFRVWSENQSYGCSLPTSPSSINFWREPLHAPRHSEYQGGASGRYPLISPIGISVLQSFGLQLPFDFVRKLFTYERVARLSFPYPSRRLITPHTATPAPIAVTTVFNPVTADVKNAIFSYLVLSENLFFAKNKEHCFLSAKLLYLWTSCPNVPIQLYPGKSPRIQRLHLPLSFL